MSQGSAQGARLHALAAALCALLLLVALCVMAAQHAPWWALCGVQGAVLVATASAGIWLDRAGGERRRGDEAVRGRFTVSGSMRYHLPGIDPEERVFFQERMGKPKEEEE